MGGKTGELGPERVLRGRSAHDPADRAVRVQDQADVSGAIVR